MSALPQDKHFMSPDEYLKFERATEEKHEYLNGEVFALAGASKNHNRIQATVTGMLYTQFVGQPCESFGSDQRVKVDATFYTYPDISVVCGEAEFDESELDTLLNPTVLIEILSPSTEIYDRGKKFQRYRELDSLQEYVLIAQDSLRIEHYLRQGEKWILTDARGADAVVTLPSIECELKLSDVYAKVEFEA